MTETLFALGLEDGIAGVTNYCSLPPGRERTRERCGGIRDPDVRKIAAIKPELVVASADENRKEDIAALEREGIPVYTALPKTVSQAIEMMRDLAALTGTAEACDRLTRPVVAIQRRLAALSSDASPVAVFCAIWKAPYWTLSDDTFAGDLLRLCGGRNVFGARSERYFPVTLQEVSSARPEMILLPNEPYPFTDADRAEFRRLGNIPAARTNRIHIVNGRDLFWYGAHMEKGLKTISALLSEGLGEA
jgi:ABC-type Fe3+-hydroxamate transport system substrate-binding protein